MISAVTMLAVPVTARKSRMKRASRSVKVEPSRSEETDWNEEMTWPMDCCLVSSK